MTTEFGKFKKIMTVLGRDLIGAALKAPVAKYPVVYALPMMTLLANKGTGIVTSVPSDSPDDYAALRDLKNKPLLRQKFGIKDEWVVPFDPVSIVSIPGFGDLPAVTACDSEKVASQNDKEALAKAKEAVYMKGFYEGVMSAGEFKGMKVKDAKQLCRDRMLNSKEAFKYYEPEGLIMSRSGDECVVSLVDQWYLTYGEDDWKALAKKCLEKMNCFSSETRHQFEKTLDWLNQWACSRSFGLGSRLPWDPQYLIESLSDSTIYMAYYSVAVVLQSGSFDGVTGVKSKPLVRPESMTRAVWDYIFLDKQMPQSDISPELLRRMKQEFDFWYPMDLRVSGKDLVPNHLTFSIYNHVAIFPEPKWPRGMRSNGHLMLNSEKMSKSTGNFKTLRGSPTV